MNQPRSTKRFSTKWVAWRLAILITASVLGLYLLSMTATQPKNLGVADGQLSKCPDKPNCVSTQATDSVHQMPSLSFSGSGADVVAKIKQVIQSDFPQARLVREEGHYLRFEFSSLIFRFVDDVEFFVDDKTSEVHFRSASRVGHSDMGKNRNRMTQISERIKE